MLVCVLVMFKTSYLNTEDISEDREQSHAISICPETKLHHLPSMNTEAFVWISFKETRSNLNSTILFSPES